MHLSKQEKIEEAFKNQVKKERTGNLGTHNMRLQHEEVLSLRRGRENQGHKRKRTYDMQKYVHIQCARHSIYDDATDFSRRLSKVPSLMSLQLCWDKSLKLSYVKICYFKCKAYAETWFAHIPEGHDSGAVEGVQGEGGAAGSVQLGARVEQVVGGDELEAAGAVQAAEGVGQGHHPARVLRERLAWG